MASLKSLLFLVFVISAVPISIIISLESSPAPPGAQVYRYHSTGWMRESIAWDEPNSRFLVSLMEGGVGQIRVPDDHRHGQVLEEAVAVREDELSGNATTGVFIDRPRNRLLVAYTDLLWGRYSALAAYDLSSWERVFLTELPVFGGEKTLADDIAVDNQDNIYVTDAKGSKIWKLTVDGQLLPSITSPLFLANKWYENLLGLNGIVYSPEGNFLLAIHSIKGHLLKVDLNKEPGEDWAVRVVKLVGGDSTLRFGDGMELISPTKLVVAASWPSGRLVESNDGWETAAVVGKFYGPAHRMASSATMKDGKVLLNHIFGLGYPRKQHVIMEAVFSS